ncbi:MAG: hypothetical protein KKE11_01225 [Gammaproteobacteria bacterium]|nr:hypothetical protein [Gammaproteobacteria bacterium]
MTKQSNFSVIVRSAFYDEAIQFFRHCEEQAKLATWQSRKTNKKILLFLSCYTKPKTILQLCWITRDILSLALRACLRQLRNLSHPCQICASPAARNDSKNNCLFFPSSLREAPSMTKQPNFSVIARSKQSLRRGNPEKLIKKSYSF